ncbi:hypothetical protein BI364_15045 [Acidihalobacter yilgarnensis]|uniref:RND efflux pump membrane fusion protein barrel-sandwich domain-containing protein n=1 Tax=Acidihalobacter yilgarnensis TaxID=2819280 RepID=A0A1D8IRQ4_9GAMM|nr:efflux RND transporter periplasmic adaptor subunit [Acidihalobacter yilgarnensis]AOU99083.1 hypothetical protein BI364_15045 [Acidihalobacter yilgarnensis]
MHTRSTTILGLAALLTLSPLAAMAGSGYAVDISPARLTSWNARISALGEVRSRAQVTLRAPVSGRLEGPFAIEGAHVARGHMIARIVPPGLDARIAAAHRTLVLDRKLLGHARALYHERLDTHGQLQQAATRVATAADRLAALQETLRQTRLTAPVAGTVRYLLPPGETVAAGSPVARLSGAGATWVRTYVPPSASRRLRTGAQVRLSGDDWHGQGQIVSIGDSARHDGLVEVFVRPEHQGRLPGEWLRLSLPSAAGRAWQLPRAALVMRGSQAEVFTVDQGRARAVKVTLVHLGRRHVWVDGPLHAGEPVIAQGAGSVANGTVVNVRAPGA